jgi:1-deoxy-D-xylulose-5-phosphate reductoisomerase
MKKHVAILGSTGSIGSQALEVIEKNPELFHLEVITAGSNANLLVRQAIRHRPDHVVIADDRKYQDVSDALSGYPIKVYAGREALSQVVQIDSVDLVLASMVGFTGLYPTLTAIRSGKNIALANKETLVVAGKLIHQLSEEYKVNIFPVDSEHSAIFQCIAGEDQNPMEKIYLTASGGPFRGKSHTYLENVTKEEALKHPNWSMGNKVTIDSATLMNKGLEVIEARWLFDLKPDQIDVIVHPQSIIHSIVQFEDGSMKAQMSLPDMKLPISYAFGYPKRIKSDQARFQFKDYPNLTFEAPDIKNFRNLAIAYKALKQEGNSPCVMNAANEIAVDAFLNGQVGFLKMSDIIEQTLETVEFIRDPDFEDFVVSDREARRVANQLIGKQRV